MMRLAVAFFFLLLRPSVAQNCVADASLCGCTGTFNGISVSLNISDFFPYPLNINDDNTPSVEAFIFSPCLPITCSTGYSRICRVQVATLEQNSCGQKITSWTIYSLSPKNFTIQYSGGSGVGICLTTVNFVQDPTAQTNSYSKVQMIKSQKYQFTVTMAGFSSTSAVGAVGLSLFFVSIAAFIAYFVVGASVMHFGRGARGLEVIPNIDFWRDFPFLIKDGVLFAFSPCSKLRGGGYSKI